MHEVMLTCFSPSTCVCVDADHEICRLEISSSVVNVAISTHARNVNVFRVLLSEAKEDNNAQMSRLPE